MGYDVKIDLWSINDKLFLGHNNPQYEIDEIWLLERDDRLWIHCKNIEAIVFLNTLDFNYINLNFFWYETDLMTLTSHGWLWVSPGNQPVINSIATLPEIQNEDISNCSGICSDYIKNYKK